MVDVDIGGFVDIIRVNPGLINLLEKLSLGLLVQKGKLDFKVIELLEEAFHRVRRSVERDQLLERYL